MKNKTEEVWWTDSYHFGKKVGSFVSKTYSLEDTKDKYIFQRTDRFFDSENQENSFNTKLTTCSTHVRIHSG